MLGYAWFLLVYCWPRETRGKITGLIPPFLKGAGGFLITTPPYTPRRFPAQTRGRRATLPRGIAWPFPMLRPGRSAQEGNLTHPGASHHPSQEGNFLTSH